MKDAKICPDGKKPKNGKCERGGVVAIFISDFQFDTMGKKPNVDKIVRGLAKQMDRKYIGHTATRVNGKVKGKLASTLKGANLTKLQMASAKELLRGE